MRAGALLLGWFALWLGGQAARAGDRPPPRASFEVQPVEPFDYVALECTGPYAGYARALSEFESELARWRIVPRGPLMTFYWNSPLLVGPAALRWSIAVPVGGGQRSRGRLVVRRFAYPRVAVGAHRGSYLTTHRTLDALYDWIGTAGFRTFGGPAIERYVDREFPGVPQAEKTTVLWVPVRARLTGAVPARSDRSR